MSDRIVQFAGVRTDAGLNPVGQMETLYCKPAPDCLPVIEASLVHGISPREAEAKGLTEHEFATRIHTLVTKSDTCTVGFNAMNFDHHFTRFLFYRNLLDPYAWHSYDDRSRWDSIDLFRAARALRPDGIKWPDDEDGAPSFRQADLAAANGISPGRGHDAASDVETMLALARLVKEAKPRLWDFCLGLRDRKFVRSHLHSTFVYVSGRGLKTRHRATIAAPLRANGNYQYAFDLAYDPVPCLRASKSELLKNDKGRGIGDEALHHFNVTASPFVMKFDIFGALSPERQNILQRTGLDLETIQRRCRMVQGHRAFAGRVMAAFTDKWKSKEALDVDEALYSGSFIGRKDRQTLDTLRASLTKQYWWKGLRFGDDRLSELVFRFRARNFPETLSAVEEVKWRDHCRRRIFSSVDKDGLTRYDRYTRDVAVQREKHAGDEEKLALLQELDAYGKLLKDTLSA